jgi:glutaredoxin-related protein
VQCGFSNTCVQVLYTEPFAAMCLMTFVSKETLIATTCPEHKCGLQILNTLNAPYETVNILEDERLRSGMKEFSQWPTFPQVYINGEFYGGCDIMIGEDPLFPPEASAD